MKNIEKFIEEKYKIIVFIILFIGLFLRFIAIDKVPIGVNVDEAGIAYDAYTIANFGTDRYNNPNPIYMINFGGGQSSLYTYISAVLVKIFGFSLFIIRMPAFLFSALYIVIAYFLVSSFKNKKFAILVEFLVVICPWHFMQSRWGLDCNLMSALMLLSVYILFKAEKMKGYIAAGICFGITLYSYAISYLIIPIFLIITLGYLLYIKKIKIINIIQLGIPLTILAIPLILNILVNKDIIKPINLGFVSMPHLFVYRENEISIKNIIPNLSLIKTIFLYDYNDYNSFKLFGTIYYISIPFCILGFIESIKSSVKQIKQKENTLEVIMLIIFISVFGILMLLDGQSINKANTIFISLIYFTATGVNVFAHKYKNSIYIILTIYLLIFMIFQTYYFGVYGNKNTNLSFNNDIEDVIKYVEKFENKKINLRSYAIQPYIYTLLASRTSPSEFVKTMNIKNGSVYSFDKYIFNPDIEISEDIVYVIKIPEREDKKLYEELKLKDFKEETYQNKYLILYHE